MIIVAVSAGIDSMVLLDILYKQNQKIVIAHVNYQKRNDSYQDALCIQEYIKDKDIIFEQLIVQPEDYDKTNFQAQARTIRYDFFIKLSKKYQTNDVYVAHHLDDYLETYLFKKERQGLYSSLGIEKTSQYKSIKIIRPLIEMYKDQIEAYARTNKINFCLDSSNETLDYTRNKIRHELKQLTIQEKDQLYQKVKKENILIKEEENLVSKTKPILHKDYFDKYSLNLKKRWLYFHLNNPKITSKHLEELIRKISLKINFQDTFLDTTIIYAYDTIYILDKMPTKYELVVNNRQEFDDFQDYFFNKFNYLVSETIDDFPCLIKNIEKSDFELNNNEYKKYRRKLIKDKVPAFLRGYLPAIFQDNQIKQIL